MLIWSSTNIKHETKLWLKVLTEALEEPFVRVDFTIVSLLNSEDEVDSTHLKMIFLKAEVPSLNLEHMNTIGWNLNPRFHEVTHIFHSPFAFTVLFHEAFLLEDVKIEELLFGGILLERFGDGLVTITD